MSQSPSLNSQNKYEIKVYGQVDDSWLDLFGEAKIHIEVLADNSQVTMFSVVVTHQAGLVGLIQRLHGHGIVLISIIAYEPDDLTVSKDVPTQNETKGKTE